MTVVTFQWLFFVTPGWRENRHLISLIYTAIYTQPMNIHLHTYRSRVIHLTISSEITGPKICNSNRHNKVPLRDTC